jgi:hypothetical protein
MLAGDGHRPLRGRALARLLPLAVLALNRGGIGPLQADISGAELRRCGLLAMAQAVQRLGVDRGHVIFGHTHRAGPLDGEDRGEWTHAGGALQLHNSGSWVEEPVFTRGDHASPYWAGRAIELHDDGPPRVVRVVDELS